MISLYSTIKMMHGPKNISFKYCNVHSLKRESWIAFRAGFFLRIHFLYSHLYLGRRWWFHRVRHHGLCMFRKKGANIALPQIRSVILAIKHQTDGKYLQRSGFVYNNGCNMHKHSFCQCRVSFIKTEIRAADNHWNLCKSRQDLLHVSVVLTVFRR